MQTVYRTIDGQIFEDQLKAISHEFDISKGIMMFDWHSQPTKATSDARVVWLADEKATELFLDMANAQGDHTCVGIEPDISGLFAWDENQERYIWIDTDIAESIAKAMSALNTVEEGAQ